MRYFGIFWGAKSKPCMPLVNVRKQNFYSFLSIFTGILISENFGVDWAYAETVLCYDISTRIICLNVNLGPIWWVSCRFFEIRILYIQKLLLGFFRFCTNNLACADCVSAETTLSLAEPTWKWFHRWLSQRRRNFCVCSASIQILTFLTWTSGQATLNSLPFF